MTLLAAALALVLAASGLSAPRAAHVTDTPDVTASVRAQLGAPTAGKQVGVSPRRGQQRSAPLPVSAEDGETYGLNGFVPSREVPAVIAVAVGAPFMPTAAGTGLLPAVGVRTPSWTFARGIASTYGPGWSPRLIALPHGPGWRFRVCGKRCLTLVSTDAGPDRAMQRLGRVVDLSVRTFEHVCGYSWRRGLCPVTVTILGRVVAKTTARSYDSGAGLSGELDSISDARSTAKPCWSGVPIRRA